MNIYHRIFKLHQRGVTPQQISITTGMPVKSIQAVLSKLHGSSASAGNSEHEEVELYLDHHITRQHKFTVLDFSGYLFNEFATPLEDAIGEVRKIPGSVIAIRLQEIYAIHDEVMVRLLALKDEVNEQGSKLMVILSPSDPVEEYILSHKIERNTKVFGTMSAFEDFTLKYLTFNE